MNSTPKNYLLSIIYQRLTETPFVIYSFTVNKTIRCICQRSTLLLFCYLWVSGVNREHTSVTVKLESNGRSMLNYGFLKISNKLQLLPAWALSVYKSKKEENTKYKTNINIVRCVSFPIIGNKVILSIKNFQRKLEELKDSLFSTNLYLEVWFFKYSWRI